MILRLLNDAYQQLLCNPESCMGTTMLGKTVAVLKDSLEDDNATNVTLHTAEMFILGHTSNLIKTSQPHYRRLCKVCKSLLSGVHNAENRERERDKEISRKIQLLRTYRYDSYSEHNLFVTIPN